MNSGEELEATRSRGGPANEVCRKVAEEIVLGNFAPSTRPDEASTADRFNVSRTPVREALKQLSIMGLVEYRPNRGSVVATMTPRSWTRCSRPSANWRLPAHATLPCA